MTTPNGPTALRRIIAAELRRLRMASDLTQRQAAEQTGIDPSAMARYEGGVSSMSNPVAEKVFAVYGVDAERNAELLDLVKRSRKRRPKGEERAVVWEPVEDLIALERDASIIREVAIQPMPGMIQTERYARAILGRGKLGADVVEDHVQARLSRATIVTGDGHVEYWVVLHEAALRCAVGGAETMRDQLAHLAELSKRPNITIQVLPDSAGAHPALSGPFKLLRFPIAPEYGIVYLDYLTGADYLDEPEEVAQYDDAYLHLIKMALSEQASLAFIKKLSKELYS
ncbi:helix-turn-helix domain-containing protein [Glycomyces buryatensis]|uniref:Helix-turn-helix domain-containing protein n=1 Tax=Glycomyces buryatensis TaxID=2570927 RepID=A0A4S8QJR2_9ACTN|nr:helix-turn-helix transcriptional regulator [Glycomyces buryatensis]THV41639.1 helix-turn-helix domain-containing protein [Glycomyces buryatensis]